MSRNRAALIVTALLAFVVVMSVSEPTAWSQVSGASPIGGCYNSTPSTLATGQAGCVQVDSTGHVVVTANAGTGTFAVSLPTTDPCQSASVAKLSVALNNTATAQLVALVAGKTIYVCHVYATLGGTTPTVQFEYGTGVTCATGTTVLTGTYLPTVGSELNIGFGGTVFATASANALCVVLAGTTPSLQGVLTYVQQ